MLLILTVMTYVGLFYYKVFKPNYGEATYRNIVHPLERLFRNKYFIIVIFIGVLVAFGIYIYFDTMGSRERIRSLMGIFILLGFGYAFSTNRSKVRSFNTEYRSAIAFN